MKKNLLNKLCATSILACTLLTAMPVAATTYLQQQITGSGYTDEVLLGSGTRYFYGDGSYLKGTAKAYKVVPWSPDTQVGNTLNVVFGQSQQVTHFSAVNTNSDGEYQKYYGSWSGSSSKASAYLSFSN
ncbi:hypothetical protein [Clostridium sp.]|uniref:hypothetical protein n=1 Tax=Clostridium sp. TaxID=1506 RepID=UPI00260EE18A|nr:hypothetical protein [Clostridium sp.]